MPIVKLDSGAGEAIKSFLAENGCPRQVRIDLHSTGCCDPSLGLCIDVIRESDLIQQLDGLTFVIRSEIHQLVGEVMISPAGDKDKKKFVLTSSKPLSEWDGIGSCTIRT